MTKFCNLERIFWKNPLDRFGWEIVCGKAGVWAIIALVLVIILILVIKASNEEN